jgi:tyrosinase
MTSPIIVTGVPTTPGSDGSVPIRREIRDLQKNYPQQWDLFCLGLLALQSVDESDDLSYYQISGENSTNIDHSSSAVWL